MFQNYQADNIITLDSPTQGSDVYRTYAASPSLNRVNRSIGVDGAKGVCYNIQSDATQDNILLSLQTSIAGSTGNSFVGYVATYAASVPITGNDVALPTANAAFVPILNVNGFALFESKVLVPKLELEPSESQYIIFGIVFGESAQFLRSSCNANLHLEDYHVFQPSK